MPSVDIDITGIDHVFGSLRALPDRTQKRIVQNAVRVGARLIRDRAKAGAPVDDGDLEDSIELGRPDIGDGALTIAVSARAPHAHLVEFGTSPHTIEAFRADALFVGAGMGYAAVVQHPGTLPNPFMRATFEAFGRQAFDRIAKNLGRGVEREAIKLANRR